MQYAITFILILFSALFSGLTLGLMGLDVHELKRKKSLGDKDAAKIYPIRKKGNLLLCTLLIGNVAINATLSIFLGSLFSGILAGILATSLIVVFGEIIPQAVFSRYSLKLGARLAWLVKVFIFILYPVCLPIVYILDSMLGEEMPTIYSKRELMKIVEEHEDSHDSDVKEDEERIIKGALTFSNKKVKNVMTPRLNIFALQASQKLDNKIIAKILKTGHSRIPVYSKSKDNIVGILYISRLVGSKNIGKTAKTVSKPPMFVGEEQSLRTVFNSFLKTKNHLFVVHDEFEQVSGIITIEDILEEIIGREIVDERDRFVDMRKVRKR